MKRLLLPAVLSAAVLVAASGPLWSAGNPTPSGPAETEGSTPAEASPSPAEQEARLARAELLAGLIPVEGPGLTVTLRNSPRKPPRGLDKSNLLLHSRDVNAVLNALRVAGAEALAVAGSGSALPERVTNNTVAIGARGAFVVNGMELRPPLRLLVIGDAAALRAELGRKDGAIRGAGLDILQMAEVTDTALVQIPAVRQRVEFRFARKSTGEAPARVVTVPEAPTSPVVKPTLPVMPVTPVPQPRVAQVVAVKPRGMGEGPASLPARSTEKTRERPPATVAIPTETGVGGSPSPAQVSEQPVGKAPSAQPALAGPTTPQPRKEPVAVAITPRGKQPMPPAGVRPEPRIPVEAVSGPVFGGKGLAKYHVSGCRFGERIGRLERVTYVSPEEARSQGRTPCQVCCSH